MTRPIALSCGEPAGIGPEIAAKAWYALRDECPFVWIGDPRHLPAGMPIAVIQDPDRATSHCRDYMPVMPVTFLGDLTHGRADPRNAMGVIDAIRKAVSLAQDGQVSAICTAPINKKALIDGADFPYPGHTEFLGALGRSERVVMMLASDNLRVVPTTIHIPLADVPGALTPQLLRETIDVTARGLLDQFGITHPRIAVAGLNPHAGEGGTMGTEEQDWIAGLIANMRGDAFTLTGPHPADTLFHAKMRETYDVVICMYHDQALIPIKTLDFDTGVNVTLGLPFIRTSPDHGTAFDIAGTGQADPSSLIAALRMAQKMAQSA